MLHASLQLWWVAGNPDDFSCSGLTASLIAWPSSLCVPVSLHVTFYKDTVIGFQSHRNLV